MCGRFNFTDDQLEEIKQIIKEVNERIYGKKVKTGEVCPTDLAAVLMWEDNRISPKPVAWGFPKWDGKGAIINARAETALEKPAFRNALLSRRCVVPSTGYYEWRRSDGRTKKEKYRLMKPEKSVLYMAGIVGTFYSSDGTQYEAFTILTTAANDSVSPLHDRMPVILQSDEIESWLRDGVFMRIALNRICPALVMSPVSADVDCGTQISLF